MDGWFTSVSKLYKPDAISSSTAVAGVLTVSEDFAAHLTGILLLYLVTGMM